MVTLQIYTEPLSSCLILSLRSKLRLIVNRHKLNQTNKIRFHSFVSGLILDARLYKHNHEHKGFTSASNDWELVYSEPFDTKQKAMAREKEIKRKKSKRYIEFLIKEDKK